jgi:two-component system osmolarity sensor histidine kinase EnvZ
MAMIDDIGSRLRLPARLRPALAASLGLLRRTGRLARRLGTQHIGPSLMDYLPKGLYARSILIVVMPILILQAVVAYVFMERHWQMVTRRLSDAVTRDIAAIIEVIETYPQDARFSEITRIAAETYGLTISVLPPDPLPAPGPRPFFSLLDSTLSREIRDNINRPFWIDTRSAIPTWWRYASHSTITCSGSSRAAAALTLRTRTFSCFGWPALRWC